MNRGSWFWPDVSDLDGAKDATRYGMWCAALVSGVTWLFAALSLLGVRMTGITPAAIADAILFAGIAYGLYRFSRFAAVAGFVLFLIEKVFMFIKTGSILGVGVFGIIILFGFLNGMRGAFAYHKLQEASAARPLTMTSES